ncbi:hypothetical protein [Borreliella afzelii]|uniref:Uncharacterized protein n=1 Tax=Borreliella afzelii (strain PKo) TaxID=390236 RepID=Q0SNA3_BORAP|nr:hypothetical protein [Borreliella afzelii]ABH01675.1 hypothetical protein BAPKO_0421 [Borreliella afzelii PKo]AEL69631.1 conserved hypothetical protein [Borreliella afzelii PKo]AFU74698.1 hypothetical protein BafHLJ01_0439 [Borreliella afzelii HLJ01]AJY72393.1 hypothetical protein BAFK78_400 [Borreliella afzelii K78]
MNKRINKLKLASKALKQIKLFCKRFKIQHYNKTYLLQVHQFTLFLKAKKSKQKYIPKNLIQTNKININIQSSSIIIPVFVIKNFLINKTLINKIIKNLKIKFYYQNKQIKINIFNFLCLIKNIVKIIFEFEYKKGEFQ